MKFSVEILEDVSACKESREAFIEKFGKGAKVEAAEVFAALAQAQQQDWLYWLLNNFPGFLQAVGDVSLNSWNIRTSGAIKVSIGLTFASGSATVRASGSATVRAYDSATVEASGSATVEAYDSATVEASGSATVEASDSATVRAYGSATVRAYDSATVRAYDSATVRASGSATVEASGSATVRAYGSATVEASGSATVEASGSATVRAYDSATVMMSEHYSQNVELSIMSPKACGIDRRSGKPVLVLNTQENTTK